MHVPTISEDAVFTSSVAGGIRTLSAGSLTVGSLNVTATSGVYSIRNNTSTATNSTLTLGGTGDLGNAVSGTSSDLLYAATGSTFNIRSDNISGTGTLNVVLGQSGTFNAAGTATVGISSVISDGGGGYGINKTGSGTLILGGMNTYSGGTTLTSGIIQLRDAAGTTNTGTLGSTSNALTVNGGALDLSGTNQVVGVLSGSGGQITSSNGSSSISVGNGGGSGSYAGSITNTGTIALIKTGAGTETLTNNNSYTGSTTINNGTLNLNNSSGVALSGTSGVQINGAGTLLFSQNNQINQATFPPITLGGGTINGGGKSQGTGGTSSAAPGTRGLGSLTLTSNSTIDLTSTSLLHFSNSSGNSWTGTLSILDWNGTATSGGGSEQILFGTSPAGLTVAQLAQVQFVDPAGFAAGNYSAMFATDLTGEIVPGSLVPVPEPSTWGAAALAATVIGYSFSVKRQKSRTAAV